MDSYTISILTAIVTAVGVVASLISNNRDKFFNKFIRTILALVCVFCIVYLMYLLVSSSRMVDGVSDMPHTYSSQVWDGDSVRSSSDASKPETSVSSNPSEPDVPSESAVVSSPAIIPETNTGYALTKLFNVTRYTGNIVFTGGGKKVFYLDDNAICQFDMETKTRTVICRLIDNDGICFLSYNDNTGQLIAGSPKCVYNVIDGTLHLVAQVSKSTENIISIGPIHDNGNIFICTDFLDLVFNNYTMKLINSSTKTITDLFSLDLSFYSIAVMPAGAMSYYNGKLYYSYLADFNVKTNDSPPKPFYGVFDYKASTNTSNMIDLFSYYQGAFRYERYRDGILVYNIETSDRIEIILYADIDNPDDIYLSNSVDNIVLLDDGGMVISVDDTLYLVEPKR